MADYNSAYTGAQIDAAIADAQTAVQPGDNATTLGSGSATNGQVLAANGSGGTSWQTVSGGSGTPGGSDTQVQFNDGGSFGGDAGFTFNKTTDSLYIGGATVTTNSPVIDMAQTWNASGTTFNGIRLNVADTASAAASLLMDLRVGGNSQFSASKSGVVTVASAGAYAFSTDLFLRRDAANTLAQRNGTNAQAFNVYNTFTDASNFERGVFDFTSVAGHLTIGTTKSGTGQTRIVRFVVGGTRVAISDGSYFQFDVDIYPTQNVIMAAKYTEMAEMTAPAAPAANKVRIYAEDDGTGKTRLMARFATGAAQQIAIEP